MHLYSAFRSEDTEAVVPAPWGKGGHVPPPPPPTFTNGWARRGTIEERLITTMQ